MSRPRSEPPLRFGCLVEVRFTQHLHAVFEVDFRLPAGRLVELRDVGKRIVDVAIKGTLNVLRIDIGSECVVDEADHLVEAVGLLCADVVDAGEFVVGSEFAGSGDIVDVSEISRLGAVTEQLRGLAVGDGVGKLGDRVGELTFVFFVAAEPLIHREKPEASHRHVVVVGVVLGVALAGEFRGFVAGVSLDGHVLG